MTISRYIEKDGVNHLDLIMQLSHSVVLARKTVNFSRIKRNLIYILINSYVDADRREVN